MKRLVRLSESDLARIVKRVIKESKIETQAEGIFDYFSKGNEDDEVGNELLSAIKNGEAENIEELKPTGDYAKFIGFKFDIDDHKFIVKNILNHFDFINEYFLSIDGQELKVSKGTIKKIIRELEPITGKYKSDVKSSIISSFKGRKI
jgi:hypothetical protein